MDLILEIGKFNKTEKMDTLNISVQDVIEDRVNLNAERKQIKYKYSVTISTVMRIKNKDFNSALIPFLKVLREKGLMIDHRIYSCQKEITLYLA